MKMTRKQAIDRIYRLELVCSKLARKWKRDILIYQRYDEPIDYIMVDHPFVGHLFPDDMLIYCDYRDGECNELPRTDPKEVVERAMRYGITEEI